MGKSTYCVCQSQSPSGTARSKWPTSTVGANACKRSTWTNWRLNSMSRRFEIHTCFTCGRKEFEDNMLEFNDHMFCGLRCKLTQERKDDEKLTTRSNVARLQPRLRSVPKWGQRKLPDDNSISLLRQRDWPAWSLLYVWPGWRHFLHGLHPTWWTCLRSADSQRWWLHHRLAVWRSYSLNYTALNWAVSFHDIINVGTIYKVTL